MKTLKQIIYAICLIALSTACSDDDYYEKPTSREKSEYAHFAVISDTHAGRLGSKEKIIQTLNCILSKGPELDAIFIVGDLTDSSREDQFGALAYLVKAYVPASVSVHYMLGNHDISWYNGNPFTAFANKTGQQTIYQYIKIKGLPFITISQSHAGEGYTQEDTDFLLASLEKASNECPGCPIFVFAHVGVINTAYGTATHEGWGCIAFPSILEKYPQVVIFSGHSHFPIGDPRSIHQGKFTAVNVGSCAYSEIEPGFTEGLHPPGYEEVTEAVIVTTNSMNDIEIERWDTYRNEEILPRWKVWAPHNGTAFTYANRTGGSAPAFDSNAVPSIDRTTPSGCVVSFPQAKDDEVVHHYIVEAVKDNQVYKTSTVFSRFYLNSKMPKTLETNVTGLEPGTKYTVQITAVDSYKNKSAKITSKEFTTN